MSVSIESIQVGPTKVVPSLRQCDHSNDKNETVQKTPASTEESLDTHLDGLHLHVRRRLSNEHDAQEIAQEACLRLLKASHSRRIDNPKAYLYRIANNLLYQHYNGRTQAVETGTDFDNLASPQLPVDEAVAVASRQELVQEAMQTLPHKCQTALILRWRHGLAVAEIADHMNLSRAMVKKYLASGLEHFRRRLRRFALADAGI